MKCPRCESSVLAEQNRGGIAVDACSQCRGAWLDQGEFERLISRVQAIDEQAQYDRRNGFDDDDDYRRKDEFRNRDGHGSDDRELDAQGRPRKRRWYESLTEMFD
ncbi:MAG: zf-TFIIB domain-containing protein [Candidatus Zixiibacteriota bacterium]